MTDFTRTKMHFALALLGTLFAIHPFMEKIYHLGFHYLGYPIQIFYAYGLIAGLLALAVYCYAMALLLERPASRIERIGNYSYAIALMVLPVLSGLYLSSLLAEQVGETHLAWAAPSVALSLAVVWLMLWQVLAWRFRNRLGEQDLSAKVELLADQEIAALNRAPELFASSHYDLSVVEAWKALEARLRRVLLLRGLSSKNGDPQAMVAAATRAGLLTEPALKKLQEFRRQWNVAVSTEPLTKEVAHEALQAARDILATIPTKDVTIGPKLAA